MPIEQRYLALLRGINVGGHNLIAKEELRHCFEELGFRSGRTYIQSGNILFRTDKTSIKQLTKRIETGLSKRFSYAAEAVVLSRAMYRSAIDSAPDAWGKNDQQKHNALFTLGDIKPEEVLARFPAPEAEFETVATGPGVIFWSASKANLGKTNMLKLAKASIYKKGLFRVFSGCPADPCAVMQFLWDRYRPLRSLA